MSLVIGLFGEAADVSTRAVSRMVEAMAQRGAECTSVVREEDALLLVGRYAWETSPEIAGEATVARHGRTLAVADAYLCDPPAAGRNGERGGAESASDVAPTPAERLTMLYARHGVLAPAQLVGEFAWILVDLDRRLVLCARDHIGRRPLHYAVTAMGRGLVVCSTATGVAAHPHVAREFDLQTLVAACSGLGGGSERTGYRDVVPVKGAHRLTWGFAGSPEQRRFWEPPPFSTLGRDTLPDAPLRLREHIASAVSARLARDTTIWMSGGRDSTAVYAAANWDRERGNAPGTQLHVASVSFPEGDMGREDHFIRPLVERWGGEVEWIDSESMPILDDAEARAAERDDPYAHTFEMMNAHLARAALRQGSRVAFDGYGGDFLFECSHVYLADLWFAGRWSTVLRRLRRDGVPLRDWRMLGNLLVLPRLRGTGRAAAEWLAGHRLRDEFHQDIAPWTTSAAFDAFDLGVLSRRGTTRRWGEGSAAYEGRWYLTFDYFPRAMSWNSSAALREGVEVRSPLMDPALIDFAAARPVTDRAPHPVTKPLLTSAMRGIIPESVLAPRARKTGIPAGYLGRRMRGELPNWIERLFPVGASSQLADAGLVNDRLVREGMSRYLAKPVHLLGAHLFLTVQAELWMRARR